LGGDIVKGKKLEHSGNLLGKSEGGGLGGRLESQNGRKGGRPMGRETRKQRILRLLKGAAEGKMPCGGMRKRGHVKRRKSGRGGGKSRGGEGAKNGGEVLQ